MNQIPQNFQQSDQNLIPKDINSGGFNSKYQQSQTPLNLEDSSNISYEQELNLQQKNKIQSLQEFESNNLNSYKQNRNNQNSNNQQNPQQSNSFYGDSDNSIINVKCISSTGLKDGKSKRSLLFSQQQMNITPKFQHGNANDTQDQLMISMDEEISIQYVQNKKSHQSNQSQGSSSKPIDVNDINIKSGGNQSNVQKKNESDNSVVQSLNTQDIKNNLDKKKDNSNHNNSKNNMRRSSKRQQTKKKEKFRKQSTNHQLGMPLYYHNRWNGRWFNLLMTLNKFLYRLKFKYMSKESKKINEKQYILINDKASDKRYVQYKEDQKLVTTQTRNRTKSIIQIVPQRKIQVIKKRSWWTKIRSKLNKNIPIYDPDSIFSENWNLFCYIFIIFATVQTSFYLTFIDGYDLWMGFFNIITFLILFIDILKQFTTTFYYRGNLVKQRLKIALNYIKNNFVLDTISILPLLFTFIEQRLALSLFIRLMYLQSHRPMPKNNISLINIISQFMKIFIFLHYFSCLWFIIGKIENDQEQNWFNKYEIFEYSSVSQYVECFYFILSQISFSYTGNFPQNNYEMIFLIFTVSFFYIVIGYLTYQIISILQFIDHNKISYAQNLNDLNNYMNEHEVDQTLKNSAKKFLEYIYKDAQKKLGAEHNLRNLSHSLKTQIITNIFLSYLQRVPFIQKHFSNETFLESLCLRITEQIYGPDEVIIHAKKPLMPCLYIVMKGEVEVYMPQYSNAKQIDTHLQICKEYDSFGQIEFFTQQFDSECSVKSVGVSQILSINLYDFLTLLQDFPRENEMFCYLRDCLVLNSQFYRVNLQCFSCDSHKHTIKNCQEIFYDKQKDKIIRNYDKKIYEYIQNFVRSKKRNKWRTLEQRLNNESIIEDFIENEFTDSSIEYTDDDDYTEQGRQTYEYSEIGEETESSKTSIVEEEFINDNALKSILRVNTAPLKDDKNIQQINYNANHYATNDTKSHKKRSSVDKNTYQRHSSFKSQKSGKSMQTMKSNKSMKSMKSVRSMKSSHKQSVRIQSHDIESVNRQYSAGSNFGIRQHGQYLGDNQGSQYRYQTKPRQYTLGSMDESPQKQQQMLEYNLQGLSEVGISQKNRQRGYSQFSLMSRVSSGSSKYIAPSPLHLPSQAIQIEFESDPQRSWFDEGRGTGGTKTTQDRRLQDRNLQDLINEQLTEKHWQDVSYIDDKFQFDGQFNHMQNYHIYFPKNNLENIINSPMQTPIPQNQQQYQSLPPKKQSSSLTVQQKKSSGQITSSDKKSGTQRSSFQQIQEYNQYRIEQQKKNNTNYVGLQHKKQLLLQQNSNTSNNPKRLSIGQQKLQQQQIQLQQQLNKIQQQQQYQQQQSPPSFSNKQNKYNK